MLGPTVDGREVGDDGYKISRQDRDGQQRAKFVDNGRESVDASDVQRGGDGQRDVERDEAGAVVLELLATLMREGLSIRVNTRRVEVEDDLEDAEDPVRGPRPEVREGACVDKVAEVREEVGPALAFSPRRELPVVVGRADPHVPHEKGEPDHHGRHAQGAAELEVAGVVDLRVHAGLPAVHELLLGHLAIGAIGMAIGAVRMAIGHRSGLHVRLHVLLKITIDGCNGPRQVGRV